MCENAIREAVIEDFVTIQHIEGKINLSDIFIKEVSESLPYILNDNIIVNNDLAGHTPNNP